jgi:hypothetical protein
MHSPTLSLFQEYKWGGRKDQERERKDVMYRSLQYPSEGKT